MVPFAASFTAGVCAVYALPALPPFAVSALLAIVSLAGLYRHALRLPAACTLGFALAAIQGHALLDMRLPASLHGADVRVTGTVGSLPDRDARGGRFVFLPDRGLHPDLPPRIRVAWYLDPPLPRPGSRWEMTLRLRAPRGFVNPAGFDYERWLLVQRFGASAYVRTMPPPHELGRARGVHVLRLRAAIDARLAQVLAGHSQHGIVRGLVLGERGGLTQRHWEVLARTGTSHLMAISGLHIGLVAGMAGLLAGVLLRAGGVTALRARVIATLFALVAAGAYAVLAGLAVPTRRAWIMLAAGAWVLYRRRPRGAFDAWACALVAVLALDPSAVASAGFWLSFSAVFIIVWHLSHRLDTAPALLVLWRIQLAAGLGLLPQTAWFFQQGALASPAANLLAVPAFSLLIVPATLGGASLAMLWPAGGAALLEAAAASIDVAWHGLERIAGWPWAMWFTARVPRPLSWLAVAGVLWACAPRGFPGRWAAVLLVCAALSWRPDPPPADAWRLVVLEVGQGLATVIHTHRSTVIYDTGPSFGPESDAGSRVVVPYLRAHGVRRVDLLVVSHPHDDHHGGAEALRAAFPVTRVLTADPAALAPGAEPCRAGQGWRVDGLAFRVLHPPHGWRGSTNDISCVLEVDGPGGRLLLPGDVEWPAELLLAKPGSALRRADVVVVPHHGSDSSSISRFVARVAPRWALIGVGHANRWGMPHPEVVARWETAGATMYDTARHGAITVDAPPEGVQPPRTMRQEARTWWRAE